MMAAGSTRFVRTAAEAGTVRGDERLVVLDTAWTPPPGTPPRVVPARRLLGSVVESADLFDEALDAVDRWAEESGAADRLIVEGVTYWFRLRETMWRWLHERLLWRRALSLLSREGATSEVAVPAEEAALLEVARLMWPGRVAVEPPVEAAAPRTSAPAREPSTPATLAPLSTVLRRVARRFRSERRSAPPRATSPSHAADERARRDRQVAERIEVLAASPGSRVVVLTNPNTYQRVGGSGGPGRDPLLAGVAACLAEADMQVLWFGSYVNHRQDEGWAIVESDPAFIPESALWSRWTIPDDKAAAERTVEAVTAAADAMRATPLTVDGVDLAPAFVDAMIEAAAQIVRRDLTTLPPVERLIGELRPRAIVLAQEGIRTPWLLAARRARVPTCAVQHGVLYANHPGYPNRRHPALVLAARTFVYGDFERRELVDRLAYRPDEVVVSGSPRLDLDSPPPDPAAAARERSDVRREVGVAMGDRMLVVSTVNLRFVQRSHFVHTLARLFDGPLPGVHLVFKQHPGEFDPGPYRDLVEGLARAGGYEAPPMSVVKDVDLYRLLRAADAHLGVLSTVLTEAVVTDTPNLVAVVDRHADLLGYVRRGVARPVRDAEELRSALDPPVHADPEARAAFLRDHFLPGNASARIARGVVEAAAATGESPA